MKTFVLLSLLLTTTIGCYGAAPPRPVHVALPMMSDGVEIDVRSETKTTIETVQKQASTCPSGHAEGSPACTITRYTAAEPITRTKTQASYGGERISYGQFLVMTDPQYATKLDRLSELSHVCQRANIPRYAGMALMLGGLIAGSIVKDTAGAAILYGGLGAGSASYALGYLAFGGRQCNEARGLYRELDMRERSTWDSVQGGDYATDMQVLAEQFNARLRGRTSMQMR